MSTLPQFGLTDVDIIKKEVLHQGFLKISRYTLRHQLYEGGSSKEFTREILERNPGVGVLLYDPILDKVVLIEQFRIGCMDNKEGPWVLELVAGIVDTEESYSAIAIRESQEEANVNISGSVLMPVCEYYNSPGGSNEKLIIMCAGVNSEGVGGVHGLDHEHEDIKTVVLDRAEAETAIKTGKINNAMSIIAIQWLSINLEFVKATLLEQ